MSRQMTRTSRKSEIIPIIISGLCTLFIMLCLPLHQKSDLSLDIGDIYKGEDVRANADIYKADYLDSLNEMETHWEEQKDKIYFFDEKLGSERIAIFSEKYHSYYTNLNLELDQVLLDRFKNKMSQLYQQGLISDKNQLDSLVLVKYGNVKTISSEQVKSLTEARQEIEYWLAEGDISYFQEVKDLFLSCLKPNIDKSSQQQSIVYEELRNDYLTDQILYKKGQLILKKDQRITKDDYLRLRSAPVADLLPKAKLFSWMSFLGYLLLTVLTLSALMVYLRVDYPDIYSSPRKLIFILMWPAIFSFLVYIIEGTENLSSYLIPFCIVPIVVKNFFSERLALFLHIVIVLIASYLSTLGYEFTFLQILAGIVTVLVITETRYWNKFFVAILVLFGTYMLCHLGLSLINSGSVSGEEAQGFLWLALATVFTLLAYPFIPLLERLFGFTSSITLVELCDMNRPLLKELSLKAPGTLQHSLQVSNLSEAAAEKIGANSLLVKAAALYHDIGKLIQPSAFIENQGLDNPHDNMNNFESAKVIIDHVIEGEKMGKKAKLPQILIDFITTHHGTTRVEYFYRKQLNDFPEQEFDESLFVYPGPLPTTKEQAILMMADSLEAASKSLKNATGTDIDQLVEAIIDGKIKHGQLENSDLTFQELEECKAVFKSLLRSINHVRIEYPEEKS